MDEDWDAVCEAVYKRIERSGWEGLIFEFVDVNEEVSRPCGGSRAMTLWKVNCAKGRGDEYRDQAKRAEDGKSGCGLVGIVEPTPATSCTG